jgi:decaprenyl-phosphate phosphoribosyltransferase
MTAVLDVELAVGPRPARPARSTTGSLWRSARPHQWPKNLLVLSGPAVAGSLLDATIAARALIAALACCLVASAAYLLNDIGDAEADRQHPTKRSRPIAAGDLSPATARTAAVAAATSGILVAAALSPVAGVLLLGYVALVIAYSRHLKRVVYLDIAAVAAGFVLRAAVGGAATHIALSGGFLVVLAATAVLAVAGKRLGEQRVLGLAAAAHRPVLALYKTSSLVGIALAAAAVSVGCYGLWAARFDGVWTTMSVVPFVCLIGRYAALTARGDAADPFDVIRHDRALRAAATIWLLVMGVGIYLA